MTDDVVERAIRDGLREEARPLARQVAELRGLTNRLLREVGDERQARVDDLGLLVELISTSWRALDERLARIERALEPPAADVVRIDERRTG